MMEWVTPKDGCVVGSAINNLNAPTSGLGKWSDKGDMNLNDSTGMKKNHSYVELSMDQVVSCQDIACHMLDKFK